ncbi:MAG: hypothetical protein N4A63_13725 [Vallitalea sp.]|jgi:hypothetical protein|nr:hypothetical protein [Vallitalea sp.]
MEYPKSVMSITELTQLGYSRALLNQWVHIKGFPCFKSNAKRGKYFIRVIDMEKWINARKI